MHSSSENPAILSHWDELRNGNAASFNKILKFYYNDLYTYGYRFTKDAELVKDCIQELFLSLWKNHATIGPTTSVKFYLIASLRRRIKKQLEKNDLVFFDEEPADNSGFETVLPIENTIIKEEYLKEQALRVSAILQRLSKRQQEIIYLKFYSEADIDEISQIMSLNKQSIYNLLHDALKKLKSLASVENAFMNILQFLIPLLGMFFMCK